MDKLTKKQQAFVDEYLLDRNGKQAAIRAGYKASSAEVQASKMLRIGKVAEAINAAAKRASEEAIVSAAEVLRGLHLEAQGLGDDTSASARVSAWEKLGKYHKLFVDKVEHSGTISIAEQILRANEKK